MIADRLKRRPWCRRRHIPIPFVTVVPADGSRIIWVQEDRAKVTECARKHLCQLCGIKLDAVIVFCGGRIATERRMFRQAPFHEECMRAAIGYCPYLRNTDDPQFATYCRAFDFRDALFELTEPGKPQIIKVFMARAIIRVEPLVKDGATATAP